MQKQRMSGQNQKTDKRIAWPIIIMNFTGVYDYEAFARNNKFIWLDCRHLYGTDGYCDREGALALKGMIADYPAEGVHFIDSGNYHYLTKFWTDKLETPFSLIVFDHHPDMQPPLFDNILSCGSWVKDILDHNNNCKKVIIVGSSDKLIQAVPKGYERQVRFYSETTLMHEEGCIPARSSVLWAPQVRENQHCLGASTSLRNRPQERFYITIKRSEMYKRISMITVQRWEWCSSPSICSTI